MSQCEQIVLPNGGQEEPHAGVCSEDRRAHFGLGSATRIDSVKVRWPSGIVQRLEDLQINTYIIIEETESALSTPPDAEVPKSSTGRRQSIQEGEI